MVDKIKLVPVTGANNIVNINDNFTKIERIINNKMLSRRVESGEINQVLTNLDMNNNRIYNLPAPQSPTEPLTAGYIGDLTETVAQGEANIAASNALVVAAQAANTEARQILDDTHIKLDDALGAITAQKDQALAQINSTSSIAIADINAKHSDVTTKAAAVSVQANQVAAQSGQVAIDAASARAASGAALDSATSAANQATNAGVSASFANTSRLAAEAASTAATVAKDAAIVAKTDAEASAVRAEAAAGSMDTAWVIARANHTGVQAISTITGLQATLTSLTSDIRTISTGGTGANTPALARSNLGLGSAAVAPIVGTTSQSAGVPTGAIIQRGSNANGEYVRYADGTQICWYRWALAPKTWAISESLAVGSWLFPITFISAPVAFSANDSGYSNSFTTHMEGVRTGQVDMVHLRNSGGGAVAPVNNTIQLQAAGRWF